MIFNVSLNETQIKALYEFTKKKLISTGKTETISSSPKTYLVLASTDKKGEFYSVGVFSKSKKIRVVSPLKEIIFTEKRFYLGPGKHTIRISNEGKVGEYTKIKIEILS